MLAKLYLALLATVALAAPLDLELDERQARPFTLYIHPASAPNMCVTAIRTVSSNRYEGGTLELRECKGTKNQRFTIGAGRTVIRSHETSSNDTPGIKLCINTSGPGSDVNLTNGREVRLRKCPAHDWYTAAPSSSANTVVNGVHNQNDNGPIKIHGTNTCLDLRDGNTAAKGVVQQWECFAGNTNQQWIVDTNGGSA